MNCLNCGGSTLTWWRYCDGCSEKRLRSIMSEGRVPMPQPKKTKWSKGEKVRLVPNEACHPGVTPQICTVVRRMRDKYALQLENGERFYAEDHELREWKPDGITEG